MSLSASLGIEHAGLFPALRPSQPLTPKDSAGGAIVCHETGQGDGQTKGQDKPEEGYEWGALLPASRIGHLVAQALKGLLFLPDQFVHGAAGVPPIGSEGQVQTFQPVEGSGQSLVDLVADMTAIALWISISLGRLSGVPAFQRCSLDHREGFPVLIQLFRHLGHDDAQKIHGFSKRRGRGGGTS